MFQENFNFIEEAAPVAQSQEDKIKQSAAIAFKRKIEAKKRSGAVLSLDEEKFLSRHNNDNQSIADKAKQALAEKAVAAIDTKLKQNNDQNQSSQEIEALKKMSDNLELQIKEFEHYLAEAKQNKEAVLRKLELLISV